MFFVQRQKPLWNHPLSGWFSRELLLRRSSLYKKQKKRCCRNAFFGASNGNRTRIASLGSWSFTIRLYPQRIVFIIPHPARFVNPFAEFFIAGIPVAGKGANHTPGGGQGGGCSPCGTWFPCPGGEDHLKRRRRLRRIVPSPPVPPLLGCRHCS